MYFVDLVFAVLSKDDPGPVPPSCTAASRAAWTLGTMAGPSSPLVAPGRAQHSVHSGWPLRRHRSTCINNFTHSEKGTANCLLSEPPESLPRWSDAVSSFFGGVTTDEFYFLLCAFLYFPIF